MFCDRCGDRIDLNGTGESAPSLLIDGEHIYCSVKCYSDINIENKRSIKHRLMRLLKWLKSI